MSGSILCVVVEAWWRPVCCSGGLCSGGLCVVVEACSGGLCVVVEACVYSKLELFILTVDANLYSSKGVDFDCVC